MRRSLALALGGFLLGVVVTLLVLLTGDAWYTYSVRTAGVIARDGLGRCVIVDTFGYNDAYAQVRCPRWTLP